MTKNVPTPKRKDSELTRKNPIVQSRQAARRKKLTKAQKQELKNTSRQMRVKQYEGMKAGDERYLPAKDKGKVRSFIRDYVDSRFSLGEYFMIIAIVLLFGSMMLGFNNPLLTYYATLLVYIYLIAVAIELFIVWRKLKKELYHRFGVDLVTSQKGNAWYAIMRMIQFRPMRMPKPKYKNRADFKIN
ncbi:MAG: DUF3043 domain-containing protein [Bifidobacteriaceae bacterium]|jgi:hypothetical protein|nr:DUF3043 domain-containing protein [Bifidobacteriaceae bacterium]